MDNFAPAHKQSSPIAIYIAETTPDMETIRTSVVKELAAHGYRIFPQEPLPSTTHELAAAVQEMLQQCVLSVHLIGATYGRTPQDSTQSVAMLQNTLAAQQSQLSPLRRILWMSPSLESSEDQQQAFIEILRNDAEAQFGAELYETHIEDLKFGIHDYIGNIQDSSKLPSAAANPKLYLICDRRDMDSTLPIEDLLAEKYDVLLPSFDGDPAQVRHVHTENLRVCDAAIVYFGSTSLRWTQAKLRELIKVQGYGRSTPIHTQAILIAPPETAEKTTFIAENSHLLILNTTNQPIRAAIAPLL